MMMFYSKMNKKQFTLKLQAARNLRTNMLRLVHCNLPLCFDMQKMPAMLRAVLTTVCQKVKADDDIDKHYTVLSVFMSGLRLRYV